MQITSLIKLCALFVIAPSIHGGQFTYDELVQHTPAQRAGLQSRLLGYLAPTYQQGYQAYTSKKQPDPLTHLLTRIPAYADHVDIQLQVNYSKTYSESLQETQFLLSFWDSKFVPVASCVVTRNSQGSRHAAGSIYFNSGEDYKKPIPAPTLMHLRDRILTILGVSEYRLKDWSSDREINFHFKDYGTLELRVLGAYMHGKTYYESKAGFQPMGTPEQVAAYHDAQQLLYNLPFAHIQRDYAGAPAIEELAQKFPKEPRFGAIVHKLYQGARHNDRHSYELLKWVNANCLTKYPDNAPSSSDIQCAQKNVIHVTAFHKFYND